MPACRIRDIRVIPLLHRMPPEDAYGMARGLTAVRGSALVVLRTEDGIEGIGEAWGPPAIARAYLDVVRPHVVGADLFALRAVMPGLLASNYHFGTQNGMVALLSGIDIAAHDAMGKCLGVGVCDLIGGRLREEVPAYASGGYFTTAEDQLGALAAQLEPHTGRGFPAFKIKIGRGPADDVARVELARRIIGDDALLTVDINGNYTADIVLDAMGRIAPSGIHWVEEPLAPQDWKGYRALAARAPLPVATGEALYTLFDFRRLIDGRLASVVQPDLALCGGLDVARSIGVLCGLEHLRLSPHVWGSGIGLAAAVHWLAALPAYPHGANVPYPPLVEYDVAPNPLQNEIFVEPIRCRDGRLGVPTGPGLGVTLDWEAVRRFSAE